MEFVAVILIAAAVFGICYLIDKGFTKLFRSQAQHRSGMSVRLSKRYGSIGLLLVVLGIGAVFVLLTFFPPEIPFFRDPVTGTYGFVD